MTNKFAPVSTRHDIASERFRLLELDIADTQPLDTSIAPPAPAPAPVPEPEPDVFTAATGLPVSRSGRDRALADEAALRVSGFAPRAPIYDIGTVVNRLGVENLTRSRRDFEEMPAADVVAANLHDVVAAELRDDVSVEATRLALDPDSGRLLYRASTRRIEVWDVTERAFRNMASSLTPGGGGYLVRCPVPVRAQNMDHWFAAATRAEILRGPDGELIGTHPDGTPLTREVPRELALRTRMRADRQGREVFGVVSSRYRPYDAHEVVAALAAGIGSSDARVEVLYDASTTALQADMLWHTDVDAGAAVAGEVFKVGVRVRSADDGTGAIRFSAMFWRNLCRNLIVVDVGRVQVASVRHVGDVPEAVRDALEHAQGRVSHFVDAWARVSVGSVLDEFGDYGITDVRGVLDRLVTRKAVTVPGLAPDTLISRLYESWTREPGYSRASIINAVTRVAHEGAWTDWETADSLERQAGQLLTRTRWDMRPTSTEA